MPFSFIVRPATEAVRLLRFSMIKASGNFIIWKEELSHGRRMDFPLRKKS